MTRHNDPHISTFFYHYLWEKIYQDKLERVYVPISFTIHCLAEKEGKKGRQRESALKSWTHQPNRSFLSSDLPSFMMLTTSPHHHQ